MKKTILLAIAALAVVTAAAFAHCGKCPGDKKAEPAKAEAVKEAGKKCGDCPNRAKAGKREPGKPCDCGGHGKAKGHEKGAAKDAKDCKCGKKHEAGKPCDCGKHGKEGAMDKKGGLKDKTAAAPAKKYACAMNCVETDKPGKCPKCGMPLEEKK